MVYLAECKQQPRTMKTNYTHRYEILHTLNLGCSFITFREPCNNLRFRYAITTCLHSTNYLYRAFPS